MRITLAEKSIPFELVTEVPWDSTTQTPQYNPLEKLPVLIDTEAQNDEDKSVYESHFILDYIEHRFPPPKYVSLAPHTKEGELFAKKVQGKLPCEPYSRYFAQSCTVIADGICDARVLMFFEKQRSSPSQEWATRQQRKVDGGLTKLALWVGDKEFLVDGRLTLADIAACSVLGYLRVRFAEHPWQGLYPNLKRYSDRLEGRASFKATVPVPQTISDKIG